MTLSLQLVTPERTLLDEQFDSISCPTKLGQITILPQHAGLVAELVPGELIARTGTSQRSVHVDGGFVQVKPGNQVIILADAAVHVNELNVELAEQVRQRAQETLKQTTLSDEEYVQA